MTDTGFKAEIEAADKQWIVDLIRNEYDKAPDLGRARYPALDSEWDDGAERIADQIITRLRSLHRTEPQTVPNDEATKYDDPRFNEGVLHVVDLLAKTIGSTGWHHGDGSEDYDDDLATTLLNILAAKGLYDRDEGTFATLHAAPDGAERLALADFGPGKDYDAEMHVRFLRAQGGGSSGYTADLIEKLYFALRDGCRREDMWRPIDTWNPRDAEPFHPYLEALVVVDGGVMAADWKPGENPPETGQWWPSNLDSEYGDQIFPTHWMPLPSAPKNTAKEG